MESLEHYHASLPKNLISVRRDEPRHGVDTLIVEDTKKHSDLSYHMSYTFDKVFSGLGSSQVEVFVSMRETIGHVLKDFTEPDSGGPATIFAYG